MTFDIKPQPFTPGTDWFQTGIGEINVCLRSEAGWITREFARLYPKGRHVSSPEDGAIQMEVRRAGRSRLGRRLYRIYGDGGEIIGQRTGAELFPFLEWGINLRVIARHSQYVQLHAASLACSGEGFLFAGGSGSGKSTLAAGLLARGWDYFCDEFALINACTRALHAFPKAICIKAGSFKAVAGVGLPFAHRRHYIKALKGPVAYIKPPHTRTSAGPALIRYIIFPQYTPDAEPRIVPISRGRAFLDLAGCIFNRPAFKNDGLPILADVVRGSECFRLQTGDLRKTCLLLEEALGVCPSNAAPRLDRSRITTTASRDEVIKRTPLPSRREALRLGTRLAYIVPTVLTFSAKDAFAQASNPSGICSTGVNTGDCARRMISAAATTATSVRANSGLPNLKRLGLRPQMAAATGLRGGALD